MNKKIEGFTLIEVLVCVAVLGSIIGIITVLLNYIDLYSTQNKLLKQYQIARELIMEDKIKEDTGAIPSPYEGFSYKKIIKSTKYQNIYIYRVIVSDGKDSVILEKIIKK